MPDLNIFRPITTFILDVDGVMTDNRILVTENGECLRNMNIRDGYAIRRAIWKDYRFFVITAGKSDGVVKRLQDLGVEHIYTQTREKIKVYESIISEFELDENAVLYMGDDMPDLEVMQRVGCPVCPTDAIQEIKAVSAYISPMDGGDGCVRDVIEKVLKLNGHWID